MTGTVPPGQVAGSDHNAWAFKELPEAASKKLSKNKVSKYSTGPRNSGEQCLEGLSV